MAPPAHQGRRGFTVLNVCVCARARACVYLCPFALCVHAGQHRAQLLDSVLKLLPPRMSKWMLSKFTDPGTQQPAVSALHEIARSGSKQHIPPGLDRLYVFCTWLMASWVLQTMMLPCPYRATITTLLPLSHAGTWLAARLAFTRTNAAWAMVGHVLGLGDRHGENIMIDGLTGVWVCGGLCVCGCGVGVCTAISLPTYLLATD